VTDDAIPSLVISHKLLGTKEWFVIHYTNCGMELFSDEIMADLIEDDLATASSDGKSGRTRIIAAAIPPAIFIKWHTIKSREASVVQDVLWIRASAGSPQRIDPRLYL
jgi:carbonic anhydrase